MGKKAPSTCFRCEAEATTREHFPPKAFFPKGGNLQLKTVPACSKHNNGKSGDDMYVLVQICLNAAAGDNLAASIFKRSVIGALKRSPAFRAALNEGAEWLESGARRYQVDMARFDSFFDSLCSALFFERYGIRFEPDIHHINHLYLSFESKDPEYQPSREVARREVADLLQTLSDRVEHFEAAKIDEVVYQNKIVDPMGARASITIAHSFYGCFEVVSLLTIKRPPFIFGQQPH
ncbi:hypothetical protein [Hoeflea sp.]|uniref:hypothetical protein n=1 Tax=Hoeflea sp. TaxID=1940281 RepID=UPI0019C383A9|nr:hypothetical protein [Hoeflea sp.]MBC7285012.1 hypothetical protein [Hoeflea sp.]